MANIMADCLFLLILMICVIVKIKGNNQELEKEKESKVVKKYGNIIFVILFVMSFLFLTYKVGKIPHGLHVDEAGALYDAICLSKYGVDRYLYKLPVYFVNFGGGQNALYTYLAAICVKLFGISTRVFRLPAVFLSLLSMLILYRVIATNNGKKEALFTSFILAICPFFIMKSRWGLESYLMCSVLTISVAAFMKALKNGKQFWYVLTGILFGLTLYTYAIAYLVVPAVVGIVIVYMFFIKKIKIKNIIAMAIPLGILALPLMLMLAMNSGVIENAKIPLFSIPKLWFYRGGEISLKNIPENIFQIFEVLFVKDFLNYNAITEFGTLYKMTIPLVIFGLIEVGKNVLEDFKQKRFRLDFIMLVVFGVVFLFGLCIAELNINKINAIYIPMIYFAGRFLNDISNQIKYAGLIIILLYCLQGGLFLHTYFEEFANTDLMYFEEEMIEASKRAEELQKSKIYVENCLNQTYIYTLIAKPISPYEFAENLHIEDGIVTEYGKYQFEIPYEIDEEGVYILKNEDKIKELIENGFKIEQYRQFCVLWY